MQRSLVGICLFSETGDYMQKYDNGLKLVFDFRVKLMVFLL